MPRCPQPHEGMVMHGDGVGEVRATSRTKAVQAAEYSSGVVDSTRAVDHSEGGMRGMRAVKHSRRVANGVGVVERRNSQSQWM